MITRMRRRVHGDDGFSLVDLIAGMTVMAIFMAIFTASLVMMYHSSNRSEAVTRTSDQINGAYLWLDRHIRYADYVSRQGQGSSGDWYIEFEQIDTNPPTCYQLRVDQVSQQLQVRSWTDPDSVTDWTPLASGVTNGDAAPDTPQQPFTFTPAPRPGSNDAADDAALAAMQSAQLTVRLTTAQGSGESEATSATDVDLPALNTTPETLSSGTCTRTRP